MPDHPDDRFRNLLSLIARVPKAEVDQADGDYRVKSKAGAVRETPDSPGQAARTRSGFLLPLRRA